MGNVFSYTRHVFAYIYNWFVEGIKEAFGYVAKIWQKSFATFQKFSDAIMHFIKTIPSWIYKVPATVNANANVRANFEATVSANFGFQCRTHGQEKETQKGVGSEQITGQTQANTPGQEEETQQGTDPEQTTVTAKTKEELREYLEKMNKVAKLTEQFTSDCLEVIDENERSGDGTATANKLKEMESKRHFEKLTSLMNELPAVSPSYADA